jgi:hypothetical protein
MIKVRIFENRDVKNIPPQDGFVKYDRSFYPSEA